MTAVILREYHDCDTIEHHDYKKLTKQIVHVRETFRGNMLTRVGMHCWIVSDAEYIPNSMQTVHALLCFAVV